MIRTEPHWVFRRLQLPNRSHDGQNDEQISAEVRKRAIWLVLDHAADYPSHWMAGQSISAKIGCSAHTPFDWVKKAEVDSSKRAGISTDVAEKLKALEREPLTLAGQRDPA